MTEEFTGQHTQLRYMTRFGCIGPDCEDHCCYGWRVDINPAGYQKLLNASVLSSKPVASKIGAAIKVIPGKGKTRTRYEFKHRKDDDTCPLMSEDRLCEVHGSFGHEMLPDVCAIYPRKLKRVGDHLELTATPSCPQLSRLIIASADAVDVVPLDLDDVERVKLQDAIDTRDVRPYFRLLVEVRDFVVELLRDERYSFEQRLFLMVWFAKRTADVLKKETRDYDPGPVHREMALLRNDSARAEICRRFEPLETPAALTLIMSRAIVRPGRMTRGNWKKLTDEVIGSYSKLASILPTSDDAADHDRAASDAESRDVSMTTKEAWEAYQARRDRAREWVGDRFDRHLLNYTIHTWMHIQPTGAPDVLTYVMRLLAQQATQKFLVYGHPELAAALDEADEMSDHEAAVAHINEVLDALTVRVFYQVARHIEHGALIRYLAKLLEARQMFSLAGAVYLVRF